MVRIKICGFTRVQDALDAVQAGADAIGLVFYPPSPRYVDIQTAQKIARAVGPFVSVVGLFVNASVDEVNAVLREVPLHVLQFHGDETPEYCAQFQRPFIKAVRMQDGLDLAAIEQAYLAAGAVGWLLDSYSKAAPGGTGEAFNWEKVPTERRLPLVLAGGLHPENAEQAAREVAPYALDVSSGVESLPGVKDLGRMSAFVRSALRGVENRD